MSTLVTIVVLLALGPMAWRNLCAAVEASLVVRIGKLLLTVVVAAVVVGVAAIPMIVPGTNETRQTISVLIRLVGMGAAISFWRKDGKGRVALAFFFTGIMLIWGIARRYVWTTPVTAQASTTPVPTPAPSDAPATP